MECCAAAEQQLCRLRQHVLTASSSSFSSPAAMAGALEGVASVYEHAEPLAQSSARAGQAEAELEASVALLDACAAARDALCGMRACALGVETAMRRRDAAAAGRAARAYASLATRARAEVKRERRRAGSRPADCGHAHAPALQEARRLTVVVLERVVVALSRRVLAPRRLGRRPSANGWSTCVARALFRKSARVACEDADGMITASLSSKDAWDGEADAALRELRALVDTVRQLEDGMELLFRRLVQCRVCLLNTCSF
ncbi:hypothetical protein U9M48_037878 [Paspalum notatum var. saurae]|uniref:Uncharacterized protein n=1 Tax=Paspalum notatum var. saurae TaxID=547442 RepID=A0AAQ3XCW4_PASNO